MGSWYEIWDLVKKGVTITRCVAWHGYLFYFALEFSNFGSCVMVLMILDSFIWYDLYQNEWSSDSFFCMFSFCGSKHRLLVLIETSLLKASIYFYPTLTLPGQTDYTRQQWYLPPPFRSRQSRGPSNLINKNIDFQSPRTSHLILYCTTKKHQSEKVPKNGFQQTPALSSSQDPGLSLGDFVAMRSCCRSHHWW